MYYSLDICAQFELSKNSIGYTLFKTALFSHPPCFWGTKYLGEGNKGIWHDFVHKKCNPTKFNTITVVKFEQSFFTLVSAWFWTDSNNKLIIFTFFLSVQCSYSYGMKVIIITKILMKFWIEEFLNKKFHPLGLMSRLQNLVSLLIKSKSWNLGPTFRKSISAGWVFILKNLISHCVASVNSIWFKK